MEKISSRNNPLIKSAAALSDSSERKRSGRFILEGARLSADAAVNSFPIEAFFITEAAAEKYHREFCLLRSSAKRSFFINDSVAEKLSDTKNSQQIFCVCEKKESGFSKDADGLYVLAENIQNPDNLGAIARTAEALGLNGLIASKGCDIYSPKALRASMGALLRFPVLLQSDTAGFIKECIAASMNVYAMTASAIAGDIRSAEKCGGAVLVIGNEGAGITPDIQALCSAALTIPMKGRAESLNAAAAAAVAMWEFMRDR